MDNTKILLVYLRIENQTKDSVQFQSKAKIDLGLSLECKIILFGLVLGKVERCSCMSRVTRLRIKSTRAKNE